MFKCSPFKGSQFHPINRRIQSTTVTPTSSTSSKTTAAATTTTMTAVASIPTTATPLVPPPSATKFQHSDLLSSPQYSVESSTESFQYDDVDNSYIIPNLKDEMQSYKTSTIILVSLLAVMAAILFGLLLWILYLAYKKRVSNINVFTMSSIFTQFAIIDDWLLFHTLIFAKKSGSTGILLW